MEELGEMEGKKIERRVSVGAVDLLNPNPLRLFFTFFFQFSFLLRLPSRFPPQFSPMVGEGFQCQHHGYGNLNRH